MRSGFLPVNSTIVLGSFAILFARGSAAPPAPGAAVPVLTPVEIRDVVLDDEFWSPKTAVWRQVTIRDAFAKFEKDGAFTNFDKVRDGQPGKHAGPPWYDGLIYEMIRAGADFLAARPDPELERYIDGISDRIAAAAAKDPAGYLNTWTQLEEPGHRWGLDGGDILRQHETYNAGAMIEAAVHYQRATGKVTLLRTATRLANHMCDVMGPPPRKNVVPGHALAEEAAVKLHLLYREKPELKKEMPFPVDEKRYLELAEFWIENRGNHEGRQSLGAYSQDHEPVLGQRTIEGHAVRATLMCAGLTAAGVTNGRPEYLEAACRLWSNMVERRMHITGGVGAFRDGERFGPDYLLPTDAYLETCAAVGAGFFHRNLGLATGDGRCFDELERVLYNGALCGVSLRGDTYFYENPLEAGKARERWAWHGCPCCPPMFLKIMAALPGYVYATDRDGLRVNLFVGSRARVSFGGKPIGVAQKTRYPWDGRVEIAVDPAEAVELTLSVRIPGWCEGATLALNGKPLEGWSVDHGYAKVRRTWNRGDIIELSLPMPIRRMRSHPRVESTRGLVALQRGPIVYCLEGADNPEGVRHLIIPPDTRLDADHRADLLGGVTVIRGRAMAVRKVAWGEALYLPQDDAGAEQGIDFTAIPYFANSNRGPGEMAVWIAEAPERARALRLPTAASAAAASASHCNPGDTLEALNDQVEPARSADEAVPRFTWWDHRGTAEWVQYDFDRPRRISSVDVYWWDERAIQRHCRVPQTWRLLFKEGEAWKEVPRPSGYGTEVDRFNRLEFEPVETKALRLEAQLQPEWSGGILEWVVGEAQG